MTDANVRISVRMSGMAIECEANEGFVRDHLRKTVEELLAVANEPTLNATDNAQSHAPNGSTLYKNESINLSIAAIAQRLETRTATDLALAAGAYLALAKDKAEFSRDELHSEMKTATGFYSQTMSGNLSKSLAALTKNKSFNQTANGKYALTSRKAEEIRSKLHA